MITIPFTSKQFEVIISSLWLIGTIIGLYYLIQQPGWIHTGHGPSILSLPSLVGFVAYLLTKFITSDLPNKIQFRHGVNQDV